MQESCLQSFNVFQQLLVVEYPFFVVEPPPFVKIFDDVHDVDIQQFGTSSVCAVEQVRDGDFRIEYSLIFFVHASGYVNVFGIHEEMLVQQAYFLKCAQAEKHEAS